MSPLKALLAPLALLLLTGCSNPDHQTLSVLPEAQAGDLPPSPPPPRQVERAPDPQAPIKARPHRKSRDARAEEEGSGGASSVRFVPEPLALGPMTFNIIDVSQRSDEAGPDVIRYRAMVEEGLEDEAGTFVETVDRVLGDPSGWASVGVRFVRVSKDEDLTVLLAQPRSVDKLCKPLNTAGKLSCALMRRANLNHQRWTHGALTWGGDVAGYRNYLVNHEIGHLLGLKHFRCPAPGQLAPVMLPQTKFLQKCKPNGTPTEAEKKILQHAMRHWKTKNTRLRARKTQAPHEP